MGTRARTLTGELSLRLAFLGAGVGWLVEAPEGVFWAEAAAASSSCNFLSRSSDHCFNRTVSASLTS